MTNPTKERPEAPGRMISLAEDLLEDAESFGEPIDLLAMKQMTSDTSPSGDSSTRLPIEPEP